MADDSLLARQRAEDELLRTKKALRESQERLHAALRAAGTGTFRWNIPTNTLEWDSNLDRLFGVMPGRTIQSLDEFVDAVHPDDRQGVRERCDRSARDGSDLDIEYRVAWPDGDIHWIAGTAKAIFGDTGHPIYMTGACTDVTGRKAAAETLRVSEERLRAIFNQAAVGIAVADLGGRFLDMNAKFLDILGYSADELRQVTFAQITHPDDLTLTRTLIGQLLAGSIPDYALEKRYVRKNGSIVWSLTTATLQTDADGRPRRLIGVIEDITPRKQAEAALQEETRVLELLNQTGRTLASTLDLHALIQAVTDAATELSGAAFGAFFCSTADGGDAFAPYTRAGASGDAPAAFGAIQPRSLFERGLRGAEARAPLAPSYLPIPVYSRSGEMIGGLLVGHSRPQAFTDRSERLLVGVAAQAGTAIDNARLYEAAHHAAEERSLLLASERAARGEAERMSALKDEFLTTLSHELRTPLNAILGWAQVLKSVPMDAADFLKGLETIERNARAQTQLIEDLLDMSRVTSGKLRLDVQPVQPGRFVAAAMETVKPAADAKGIRLEAVLDPSAGPISGDPSRLQQIIWNLLSNAIKFTPKGGKVQVLLARVNSHVEITVADTGVGIAPSFLPHLFERFRQADASTTRTHGGLGLGLSIVKSLVELHGGIVSVTSAGEALGTTATVQLPLTAVRAGAGPRRHPTSPDSALAGSKATELAGLTILVVDDQPDARDLIKRVLESSAAAVMTAGDANEALRLVEAHRPDVLVSDIGMPEADGFELLRRVRALGPERGGKVPAIALTAFARSEDRTRALRAGFLVHVAKPVDPSELVATVATVAGRIDEQHG